MTAKKAIALQIANRIMIDEFKRKIARYTMENREIELHLENCAQRWGSSEPDNDGAHFIFIVWHKDYTDDDIRYLWGIIGHNWEARPTGYTLHFNHEAVIVRKGSRVLVKQFHALDI